MSREDETDKYLELGGPPAARYIIRLQKKNCNFCFLNFEYKLYFLCVIFKYKSPFSYKKFSRSTVLAPFDH